MNKFLVTLSVSFIAPDGRSYFAAWGRVGIGPNPKFGGERVDLHWIGDGDRRICVKSDHITCIAACDERPKTEPYSIPIDDISERKVFPNIYITE